MKTTINSILNLTWKVGLGLVGLVAGIIIFFLVINWYDGRYGRAAWRDETLSKNVEVHGFNDGRVRIYNSETEKYVTPKLRWVSGTPRNDSLTVYADKKGNRGYLDCNSGKIVLPANKVKYRHAWHFSKGRAFVVLPDEDSLSVIDAKGNVIVRNVAVYDSDYDYVFSGNGLCELEVDGMSGLLGLDGSWTIEPKYYYIGYPNIFGYRIARNEEGYWLYDPQLKPVYSEPYDYLEFASGRDEGEGTLYRTRNHVKELVNYDGSIVEPFVIDGTYNLRYMVKYNEDCEDEYELDPDLVVYQIDGWEGLMNKHTGRLLTPAVYTDFEMISKELIKVELSCSDDNAVIMDRSGRIVNP